MAPPENAGAFLVGRNELLEVRPAPYQEPGPHEIVVKNAAVAINPFDHIIQEAHQLAVSWVKLPFILGEDVAGTVHEVGSGVTRFKVGDRVFGQAIGLTKEANRSCESGFQRYTILREHLAIRIPDRYSFEEACVLPLGMMTAICALYKKEALALDMPNERRAPTNKGVVVVWGGASSVGLNCIQLANASGYEVVTTASPKNHDYVKSAGAMAAFDYKDENVVAEIVKYINGRTVFGAVSVTKNSLGQCVDIMAQCKSGRNCVAACSVDNAPWPKSAFDMPRFVLGTMFNVVPVFLRSLYKGVSVKIVMCDMADPIANGVFSDYLPDALEHGAYFPVPPPLVIGKGLESIQEAITRCKEGISAGKAVVSLE